ncbi:MAG: UDP-N-acetylglucosamine 2-epimerase (hydrolyzing) [Myxococcales bacterium]|nr:UDP-N-acetylglucosamine 2-epimerase (hydrolyzing) [Myxococcales bacterium]
MSRRRVLAVTGIRSEYFHLRPVLRALVEHGGFELGVCAMGAHLAPIHDFSVRQIEADGFAVVERVVSLFADDSLLARTKGIGLQVLGLSQAVAREQSELILVLGDREEALVAALVGCYMNVPVAHLAGGDRTLGNIDDSVRHAVSKLAHLHFAFSEESAQRLLAMGEEAWRVVVSGAPALDEIAAIGPIDPAELGRRLDFPAEEPYFVLIQHGQSSEIERAESQIELTLAALAESGAPTAVIAPNTDTGSRAILAAIEAYVARYRQIRSFAMLERPLFINLLRHARALVGNSSCGLIEAPFLGLPAINLGNRQSNRLHAENVLFVPFDPDALRAALQALLHDAELRERLSACASPYGDGGACPRIVERLAAIPLDRRLLDKDFVDPPR